MITTSVLGLLTIVASMAGPHWRYQELSDAISDRTGAALEISSADEQAKLIFACDLTNPKRSIGIQFQAPQYLGGEYGNFVLRADKSAPISGQWSISYRTGYTFDADIVRPAAAAISAAESVYVRAFDYDGQPVNAQFVSLPQRELFQKVAIACGQPDFFK